MLTYSHIHFLKEIIPISTIAFVVIGIAGKAYRAEHILLKFDTFYTCNRDFYSLTYKLYMYLCNTECFGVRNS